MIQLSLLIMLPVLTSEDAPRRDDPQSLLALSQVQMILKRNGRGSVESVVCAGCRLKRAVPKDLLKLKGLHELREVNLQAMRNFTDDDVRLLVDLESVTAIRLPIRNQVSDAGIAQLTTMRRLESLSLGNQNGVTDAAVAHLATLRNLRLLDLGFSAMKNECVRELAQHLPKTKILHKRVVVKN